MNGSALADFLAATVGLWVLLAIAAGLAAARWRSASDPVLRRRAWMALALASAVQAAHFAEEAATGFARLFPPVLGSRPWPEAIFVGFNLAWLVVWALSTLGLARGFRIALVPAWFLALAEVVNGVAHPLLAWRAGGYFPGLWTSPVALVAGLLLLRELARVTAEPPATA